MNTKIMIAATVAALSLATTAFAEGEGRGQAVPSYSFADSVPLSDTGSAQYQGYSLNQLAVTFDNSAVLQENGQNRPVQSANSLPRGFENGTEGFMQAQSVNRWFAQQADHRFALQQAVVNGRRG